jgi:hypothetical protein
MNINKRKSKERNEKKDGNYSRRLKTSQVKVLLIIKNGMLLLTQKTPMKNIYKKIQFCLKIIQNFK